MEACAAARLRFVVCDRPNPIGGEVEGAPPSPGYLTFVGLHPIPVRHGMTAGELARLFAAERRLDLDLVVSPVSGWARDRGYAGSRPALGAALAEHADDGHGARLSGDVPPGGNEPLGGSRDHAAVRGLRRALARCRARSPTR